MKSNEALEEVRDEPRVIVDKGTAQIINSMTNNSNPQLKSFFGNLDVCGFGMNGVKLTYQDNSFIVEDNIHEFSDGIINVLTNPNVTYDDRMEEDENKIQRIFY